MNVPLVFRRLVAVAIAVALLVGVGCTRRAPGSGDTVKSAPEFARAEIFFVPWEWVTGVSVTPASLHEVKDTATVLRNPAQIQALLELMNLTALGPADSAAAYGQDYRVAIDLVRADGTTEAFAANRFALVRLRDGASRPIDEAFRAKFPYRP
jgi:hypothetical protein